MSLGVLTPWWSYLRMTSSRSLRKRKAPAPSIPRSSICLSSLGRTWASTSTPPGMTRAEFCVRPSWDQAHGAPDAGRVRQSRIGCHEGTVLLLCRRDVSRVIGGQVAAEFPDPGRERSCTRHHRVHGRRRCCGVCRMIWCDFPAEEVPRITDRTSTSHCSGTSHRESARRATRHRSPVAPSSRSAKAAADASRTITHRPQGFRAPRRARPWLRAGRRLCRPG